MIRRWLGIGLGLAVLIWVGRAVAAARGELLAFAWSPDPAFLGLSFAAYSAALLVAIWNWGDLLARLERPAPFRTNVRIYCYANLMKRLPGVFWHFVGRAALYQGYGISARATTLASTLELVLYVPASGLIYLGLAAVGATASAELAVPVAGLTGLALVLLHPRLANLLMARVYPDVGRLRVADVVAWVAVNGGVVVLGGTVLFCLLRSALPLPLSALPLAIGAWSLAVVTSNVLFFVPGGIGIREGVLVAALSPLAPVPVLAILAVAFRLWGMACEIGWAALAAILLGRGDEGKGEAAPHPFPLSPPFPFPLSPRPRVGIVVLSWNGREDTLKCLGSVSRLDYPERRTIVVDNASSDGTVAAVRAADPDVEIVQTGANLGYGRAMNVGIERALAAGAAYVLLLNNDTRVDPPMLWHLVAAMAADEQIGIAGPKTLYLDDARNRILYAGARERWLTLLPDVRGAGEVERGQFDRPAWVDFVWGDGLLLRRSLVERIGGFDPAFFMYYEDIDLCLRARAAGFRLLYVPAARMWHRVGASTRGNLASRWRFKAESAMRLYRKHNASPAVAALKLGLTAAWILGRELGRGKVVLAARLAVPYLAGAWQGLRGK